MKQNRRRVAQTAVCLLAATALCTSSARAEFWSKLNPLTWFSSKSRPHTLIVTGNYTKSRLLAELIQYHNAQPILLISPRADGEGEVLYFLTSDGQATAIEAEKYMEFVDWLAPKRIVFLGDDRYVPPTYVEQVRARYPMVCIPSDDWSRNAEAAAKVFGLKKLSKRYSELASRVDVARPMPPSEAAPAAPSPVPAAAPPPAPVH